MTLIIVDLEATCWEVGQTPDRMEIIEIGAVRLDERSFAIRDEFQSCVRPVAEPELSEFCLKLTGIRQEEVSGSEPFPAVYARFVEWIGAAPFQWCSWGRYDLRQMRTDAKRHGLTLAPSFERHVNLKKVFASLHTTKPKGMAEALTLAGLELEGRHHRGLDDARNIARLAQSILPRIRLPSA